MSALYFLEDFFLSFICTRRLPERRRSHGANADVPKKNPKNHTTKRIHRTEEPHDKENPQDHGTRDFLPCRIPHIDRNGRQGQQRRNRNRSEHLAARFYNGPCLRSTGRQFTTGR